jgi:hypothetical protein
VLLYQPVMRGRLIIMRSPSEKKSSLENIKKRFDNDVERFSNLKTGQSKLTNKANAGAKSLDWLFVQLIPGHYALSLEIKRLRGSENVEWLEWDAPR